MNRDIKFKFWLGHTKKMTYEHSLIDIAHSFWDFTEDIIPLQYTGLKDKNGKEIFEGDILKSWYSRDMSGKDIVWMTYAVEYEICEGTGTSGFQIDFLNNAEIIGNIYENEELIN